VTPLLRPTPEEVLKSISYTFDELIRPDPLSPLAVSYSLTVSNMLRQLLLSLQHEEGLITEDTAALRTVLEQARDFLQRHSSKSITLERISGDLAVKPDGAAPAKAAREHWRALRWTLEDTINHLQEMRNKFAEDPAYRDLRQSIRDYLDQSLERENTLIAGAFTLARR